MDSSLRQCAWCLTVMDDRGAYSLRQSRKIKHATHGICPSCKASVRAEIDRGFGAQPALLAA